MPTRLCVLALTLLAGSLLVPVASAEPPRLDRIRYDRPADYVAINATLGDPKALTSLAAQLKKPDAPGTLRSLWLWARRNLPVKHTEVPTWRTVSEMIKAGNRNSAAEGAMALGVLARASGIPTVWVKSVSLEWLKAGADAAVIVERTFLEVHLDGAWRLLDPVTMRLYDRYDTKAQLLPGDFLAFDKGSDPRGLLLPNQHAGYVDQVRRYFANFDVRRLPWGQSRDLLASVKVYIAGVRPVSRYVKATCETMGFLVEESFTQDAFDRLWPKIRGGTLIVTSDGTKPRLPKAHWSRILPPGSEAAARGGKLEKGYLGHKLRDGTRVIFTPAQGYAEVEIAIARALSELK